MQSDQNHRCSYTGNAAFVGGWIMYEILVDQVVTEVETIIEALHGIIKDLHKM